MDNIEINEINKNNNPESDIVKNNASDLKVLNQKKIIEEKIEKSGINKRKDKKIRKKIIALLLAVTATASIFAINNVSTTGDTERKVNQNQSSIMMIASAADNDVSVKANYYISTMSNIYTKPYSGSKKITTQKLDYNTKIYVKSYNKKTGWANVKINGKYGYIKYKYLSSKPLYDLSKLEKGGDYTYSNKYKGKITSTDIDNLARALYLECGSVKSKTNQANVAWCILNYCDIKNKSITEILKSGYCVFNSKTKIDKEMRDLAEDVVERWKREHNGEKAVGRTIPRNYYLWVGDGTINYFRNKYKAPRSNWDQRLMPSPYNN